MFYFESIELCGTDAGARVTILENPHWRISSRSVCNEPSFVCFPIYYYYANHSVGKSVSYISNSVVEAKTKHVQQQTALQRADFANTTVIIIIYIYIRKTKYKKQYEYLLYGYNIYIYFFL